MIEPKYEMNEPDVVSAREDIVDAMARYGGSFVRKLAELYGLADDQNRTILRRSFSHYFAQYDELAQLQRAGREVSQVLHMEQLDHPANVGTNHKRLLAECGQYYWFNEFAGHVDDVTCPKCRARLDAKEKGTV